MCQPFDFCQTTNALCVLFLGNRKSSMEDMTDYKEEFPSLIIQRMRWLFQRKLFPLKDRNEIKIFLENAAVDDDDDDNDTWKKDAVARAKPFMSVHLRVHLSRSKSRQDAS